MLSAHGLSADNGPGELQKRVIDIYRSNEKAVVKVYAAFENKSEDGKTVLFIGTGFYISKEGHILTNTNVTYGADRIWVESKGIAYTAEHVGSDPLTNVSIIKVFALPSDFHFLRFTDSPETPPVGSFLVGLSCEMGQDPGPSLGLVTGWNTNYGDRVLPTIYLRSDIPSTGGEGGAPVFDINGSLVGMIIVSLPELGSSFILPARAIQRIRDDILFSGKVTYAYFGFQTRQKSNLNDGPWVEVEDLIENGPAAKGGVQVGDIILKLGDFPVKTDADLRIATFYQRPGEFVTVLIRRGEEEVELSLKPGAREAPPTAMPPVGPSVPGPEEVSVNEAPAASTAQAMTPADEEAKSFPPASVTTDEAATKTPEQLAKGDAKPADADETGEAAVKVQPTP